MAGMFSTRTTCLRAWRLSPNTISTSTIPTMLASHSTCRTSRTISYSCREFLPKHSATSLISHKKSPPSIFQKRLASSSPNASATLSSVSTADQLTWNRFFDLRKKRRYINLMSSVITAAGTVVVAGPLLAAQDVDTWGAQLTGIDPVFVLGASTLAVGLVGWLCGPSFGNLVFKIWAGRRGWNGLIAQKEKSFYARIKRYRADPSSSSPQNPIPDYYGEKIASVKDYRRWLKDQKAFNLKKDKNML